MSLYIINLYCLVRFLYNPFCVARYLHIMILCYCVCYGIVLYSSLSLFPTWFLYMLFCFLCWHSCFIFKVIKIACSLLWQIISIFIFSKEIQLREFFSPLLFSVSFKIWIRDIWKQTLYSGTNFTDFVVYKKKKELNVLFLTCTFPF